jgi:hypothetical protein
MKKLKLILTSLALVLFVAACENDGGDSKVELTNGATPNVKKITTTDTSINLLAIKNDIPINIGFTVGVGFGNVTSMDVVGIYTKGTVVEKAVIKANLTTFPATVNINQTDLINAFSFLNSKADFSITDKLTISTDIVLNDGRKVEMFNSKGVRNFGADISNSLLFSVSQNYVVSCPLTDASLFNGNYKVTADQWEDYTVGATVPVVYNPADGLFKFRILNTNNAFISNSATSYMIVTINPADGKVTVAANETYNYGVPPTTVTGTGTISSCTGDINLKLNFVGGFNGANQTFTLVKL